MKMDQLELANVEKTVVEARDGDVRELSELQLVLVGGGYADPIAY